MKTKLVVRDGITSIRFDEKSFFSTILGFNFDWNYRIFKRYISQTFLSLSTTNKIHLKSDCINGSITNGVQQPILYSFVLDKPAVYKIVPNQKRFNIKM